MVAAAIEQERFLIVTHEEDAVMLAERATDRDGHLRRYVEQLYVGRGPDGIPLTVPSAGTGAGSGSSNGG
jgi:hypothetical protein